MKMPELPTLPKPDKITREEVCNEISDGIHIHHTYFADTLHAYALAYGELVREECAKHVEAMTANWEGSYKRSADLIPPAIRSKE